jgi:hypothetical protein
MRTKRRMIHTNNQKRKEKRRRVNDIISVSIIFSLIFAFTTITSAYWGDIALEKLVADANWRGLFIGVFYRFIAPSLVRFFDYLEQIILMNPPLNHSLIYTPLSFFIKILEPVYVFAIIVCGFYLIFMSGSPQGRAKAKSLLPKLIISMVLVTLSPYILQLLLNASVTLANDILVLNPAKGKNIYLETFNYIGWEFAYKTAIDFDIGYVILLLGFLLIFGIFFAITLRYILLTTFLILFPLAIFFYFFDITKGLGRKMLEQTFIWAFAQGMYALIYVLSTLGVIFLGLDGRAMIITGLVASFIFIISPFTLFILIRRFLP